MTVLRILTIVLPILFLVVVDLLRHTILLEELHTIRGFLATYGITAVAVTTFSWAVFGLIERLQRQLVEQNQRLAALNRVAAALAENVELQQLLEVALDNVLSTMRVEAGLICTLDKEHEELAAVCYRGLSEALVQRVRRSKLADVPIGERVVRTGQPVIMERIFEDPRVSELAKREGIRSTVSVPLKVQGEVVGVLAIISHEERRFLPGEVEIMTNLGNQLGMVIRNSVLYEEARRTNAELTTLLKVGAATTSSLQLPEMLGRAMDTLLEVTGVEAAEVWTAEGSEVVLQMRRGPFAEAFLERTRFSMGEGFPGIVAQTRSSLITHRLPEEPQFLRQEVKEAGFHTFCAWPLLRQDELLGVLAVAAQSPEALTRPTELRLFQGIAEHLAIAIENALLHQQVQDVAVLEERERIAREMHDSLAQVLGYINTQVLALRKLLLNGSSESAVQQLGEMQEAVQQLYADVREGILGLRSSPGDAAGLLSALDDYLERYRSMADFEVVLQVSPETKDFHLPHASEIQLMRIIQEALSNTRKHARASRAVISLTRAGDGLKVEVRDNGIGFDPSSRPSAGWPRFGLQTMRERAEAVGGKYTLESAPGQGTRVVVNLPVAPE